MTIREQIIEALREKPGNVKINIGMAAWNRLKTDPNTVHEIALVGERLFFQGVQINPFVMEYRPDEFEVVPL